MANLWRLLVSHGARIISSAQCSSAVANCTTLDSSKRRSSSTAKDVSRASWRPLALAAPKLSKAYVISITSVLKLEFFQQLDFGFPTGLFECHWQTIPSGMFCLHLLRPPFWQQSFLPGGRSTLLRSWSVSPPLLFYKSTFYLNLNF